MRWFHRCAGKPVAVSHYVITESTGSISDTDSVGVHTRILYRCSECGELFVNTLAGKWTLEQIKARP